MSNCWGHPVRGELAPGVNRQDLTHWLHKKRGGTWSWVWSCSPGYFPKVVPPLGVGGTRAAVPATAKRSFLLMNRATLAALWEQQLNRWGQWSPEVDCEPIWSIHALKHLRRSLLRQWFFSHSQSGALAFMLGGSEERRGRGGAEPITEGKPRNPARAEREECLQLLGVNL